MISTAAAFLRLLYFTDTPVGIPTRTAFEHFLFLRHFRLRICQFYEGTNLLSIMGDGWVDGWMEYARCMMHDVMVQKI